MGRTRWSLLVVVLAGAGLAGAEEPPYKRLLQGDDAKKAAALTKQVKELWAAGKFAEGVAPAEEVLALRKRVQGEGHWEVADAAWQVAMLRQAAALPAQKRTALAEAPALMAKAGELQARARYAEAERLYRKGLAVCEEVLGPRHRNTAACYNNLALNLQEQGRAKEAEPLYRKALAVREEVLGSRHPDTAFSCNNLAYNLDAKGRYQEAEPLYRKALAIKEEVLGPRHPDTAQGYNNLAGNLRARGRYKDAEPLYRKALAIWEEVLGPRHPDTAQGYNNLAANLQAQGQAKEAEPLYRKALAIKEEVLGPRHPLTARGYNNLAYNLDGQGRYQEAEPLYRKALAIKEEVLGPRHPDTAHGYNNLAVNLDAKGRYQEAEPLYRKALAVLEEALGPRHPDIAFSYNNLAANLQGQGRAKEAEPLYRRALAVREEVLGSRHPDTAASYNGLAYNLDAPGRAREAELLLRKALAIWEQALGPRHPDTARSYNNLAGNLEAQGRAREAEPLFRKALAVWEEVLGPRHPLTAAGYNHLAANLQEQGKAKDAEAFWGAGAEGIEAARLRLAASALDKAAAVRVQPHLGLAACRARLGRPADAWAAAEAGLARGLLDDLAARTTLPADSDAERRDHDRAARLDAMDRLLPPLLTAEKLDEADRRRRDGLLKDRAALDDETARAAAEASHRAVLPLAAIQAGLKPDQALVLWIDFSQLGDHWGCVLRRSGPPAWVRLPGSGPKGAWTEDDDKLPRRLREDLSRREPGFEARARRLAAQRLGPLAPHLVASADLPEVRRLVVVPVGRMAGVPVEVLSDRYLVSYAPSGSVLARLHDKHRPLGKPTLLALGDPTFALPSEGPPPTPPEHGLYLALVLPGGNAARAGLRAGDVLLSYAGTRLTTKDDLKTVQEGDPVPVVVWRAGQVLDKLRLAPGKLGVAFSADPPAAALRQHRELDVLADARDRSDDQPLPGTRLEVSALAALLPREQSTVLLGSRASEQELDTLASAGGLKRFGLIHLATHGTVDPVSAARSALKLARDRLPGVEDQARLAAAGKKVYTGQLSVETIASRWELDADLVALSACETALGPEGGGEGLLGFSQVLLGKGAHSLLLSLWKADDTATALLMSRFYQNLLGQRDGLKEGMPKAEALREAKRWLRALPRTEAEELAGRLAKGVVRGPEEPARPAAPQAPAVPAGEAPFAHPRYWAAFILLGDPD
jgi:tetratricopeptide (TPR) repeat protein